MIEVKKMYTHPEKGFTVVELVVVLAVIGILATLSVLSVGQVRKTSRDVLRLANMKEVYFGLELYFNEHSDYPNAQNIVLGSESARCLDSTGFHPAGGCEGKIWLSNILPNPLKGELPFVYNYDAGPPKSYLINFSLEKNQSGLMKGNHVMQPSGIR